MMMDVGKGVKVVSDGRRSCGSPDIEGKRLPDAGQLGPHVQPLGHDAHTSHVQNAIEKGAFSASNISAGGQKYPDRRRIRCWPEITRMQEDGKGRKRDDDCGAMGFSNLLVLPFRYADIKRCRLT